MPFSVLIPVYHGDEPHYFEEALSSVFHQTVEPDEVVVVEDGQLTQDLYDIVERMKAAHPTLKVVALAENSGLGHALNMGLTHCSHELVARMDSDDVACPTRFERQLAVFAEHPETDICSGTIAEFIGTPQHVVSHRTLPETHEAIYAYGKRRCPVNHPAVMYRKSSVQKVGGYEGYPEDINLWHKMLARGQRFYNIQDPILWFRLTPELYDRRGGWHYAITEVSSLWFAHTVGYTTLWEALTNIAMRFPVRIIPSSLRAWLYRHFLR